MAVAIAWIIYETNVIVEELVELNGAVICLFYVYVIPIVMHLWSLYGTKSCGFIEGDEEHNSQVVLNEC